mgnify:CR=1 FL=1
MKKQTPADRSLPGSALFRNTVSVEDGQNATVAIQNRLPDKSKVRHIMPGGLAFFKGNRAFQHTAHHALHILVGVESRVVGQDHIGHAAQSRQLPGFGSHRPCDYNSTGRSHFPARPGPPRQSCRFPVPAISASLSISLPRAVLMMVTPGFMLSIALVSMRW